MIYFFKSSRKSDKLTHPLTISTNGGKRKAVSLAIMNFVKNGYKGSPRLIAL